MMRSPNWRTMALPVTRDASFPASTSAIPPATSASMNSRSESFSWSGAGVPGAVCSVPAGVVAGLPGAAAGGLAGCASAPAATRAAMQATVRIRDISISAAWREG